MSKKIKIVADDKIPFLKGILEPFADVEYYPGRKISKENIFDADALIVRTRTKCNSELLSGTKIKFIATATIGYDHIDTDFCAQNNIDWLNAPGCNSTSVMQYISSALLTLAKVESFSLSDKLIGIVGVGNVGREIQKVAKLFGMQVLLNDPPRERKEGTHSFCSLEKIINESDLISFHVPLIRGGIDKTFHLADEKFFECLCKKPIILNSSRGEVVKTSALKEAIKSKQISNAVIDVWENEPDIDLELLELVKFATPHIAGYSVDGKANGTAVCVNAINRYFRLGLKSNWYPENIPFNIHRKKIEIDCENKTNQELFTEAIDKTYSILEDNYRLRKSPSTFEQQREEYPARREFSNYEVKLNNFNLDMQNSLKLLGFN